MKKTLSFAFVLMLCNVANIVSSQTLTPSRSHAVKAVGNNKSVASLTRSSGSSYGGNGNYNWTVTPAQAGITLSGAAGDNAREISFDASVPAGTYSIKLQRGSNPVHSATTTITLTSPNFWAAYGGSGDNSNVRAFTIGGGTYTAGPDDVFTAGQNFAALGRSPYPTPSAGYFYWIPNSSNTGSFTLYGVKGDGTGGNVAIGSKDLNGSGNSSSLGYVRLGLDANGIAWILASDGSDLYLSKVVTSGLTAVTPVLMNSVTLSGGSISTFENGDLCFDGNGNMYVLANKGGSTEIYIGRPGNNTTLTKKWNILDNGGNAFAGMVNGCCFDEQGGMYLSTNGNTNGVTDGIYYLSPATIANTATGATINAQLVFEGSGYTDLGTNVFPAFTALPVRFGEIKATSSNGQLTVQWQSLMEQNCKEYNVEASSDGKNWVSIGKLTSKAINGHSANPIDYKFTGSIPVTLGAISLAFLLCSVFKSRMARIIITIAFIGVIASCSKSAEEVRVTQSKDVLIRIAQQDADGGVQYSKIIKVANE